MQAEDPGDSGGAEIRIEDGQRRLQYDRHGFCRARLMACSSSRPPTLRYGPSGRTSEATHTFSAAGRTPSTRSTSRKRLAHRASPATVRKSDLLDWRHQLAQHLVDEQLGARPANR
jgi:hypothetical protein